MVTGGWGWANITYEGHLMVTEEEKVINLMFCPNAEICVNTTFIAARNENCVIILCFWTNAHCCLLTLDLSFMAWRAGWIFAKHCWSVCYSEWRELGWALSKRASSEGGGRMEINSIFRNEKGGKNRDRVKQLRDLRTHAFNLRALTVQAGQATNDARVLEGEIFPPWGHEGILSFESINQSSWPRSLSPAAPNKNVFQDQTKFLAAKEQL